MIYTCNERSIDFFDAWLTPLEGKITKTCDLYCVNCKSVDKLPMDYNTSIGETYLYFCTKLLLFAYINSSTGCCRRVKSIKSYICPTCRAALKIIPDRNIDLKNSLVIEYDNITVNLL